MGVIRRLLGFEKPQRALFVIEDKCGSKLWNVDIEGVRLYRSIASSYKLTSTVRPMTPEEIVEHD
jgi:hypothetical protein